MSSHNPGGRRKDPRGFDAFRERCREMEPQAMRTLAKLIDRGEIRAVELVLAYAWGKPPATFTGPGGDGPAQIEVVRRIVDAVNSDKEPTED